MYSEPGSGVGTSNLFTAFLINLFSIAASLAFSVCFLRLSFIGATEGLESELELELELLHGLASALELEESPSSGPEFTSSF